MAAVSALSAALLWPSHVQSHEAVETSITFDVEISRILTKRCISCHSPDNLAFPLTSYEQTRPWARAIEEEVLERHMPPWRAVDGYGDFANDGGLTLREHQLLLAWIDGNGPKNKAQRLIVNIDQSITPPEEHLTLDWDRWDLGRPDATIELTPVAVDARAADHVRRVEVPTNLSRDRWVEGIELHPSDRRLVRAAFFTVRETGQWLGAWTPWQGMTLLPEGTAVRVPAGAHLVAELHLRGASEPAEAGGTIGLGFAQRTPSLCATGVRLTADGPAETSPRGSRVRATSTIARDTTLLAVVPTLPPSATSLEVAVRPPGGPMEVVLLVRGVAHEWPTPYIYREPIPLPAGTELSMASYLGESKSAAGPLDLRMLTTAPAGGACLPASP